MPNLRTISKIATPARGVPFKASDWLNNTLVMIQRGVLPSGRISLQCFLLGTFLTGSHHYWLKPSLPGEQPHYVLTDPEAAAVGYSRCEYHGHHATYSRRSLTFPRYVWVRCHFTTECCCAYLVLWYHGYHRLFDGQINWLE